MFRTSREYFRYLIWLALAAICVTAFVVSQASRAEAEPLTAAKIGDIASASWSGTNIGASGNPYGGNSVASVGDINADGIEDIAVMGQRLVAVLFTPRSGHDADLLTAELPASRGYIVSLPSNVSMTQVAGIGDQNDDGVPDIAIGDGLAQRRVFIIYGVADTSTLPNCSTGTSKCIDATNTGAMPLSTGYVFNAPTASGNQFGVGVAGLNGFSGSDSSDFVISAPRDNSNTGMVYVIKGGFEPTSSPFDINTASSADVLKIEGSQPGGNAGTAVNDLGDMNGDGLTDLYIHEPSISGMEPGRGYVVYGGGSLPNPMDLASFGASLGFMVTSPLLSPMSATNAGDVNGDGRPDLALGGYGLTSASGSAAVVYGPASSPEEPISVTAPTPDQGYVVNPGDSDGQFGTSATNAGDLNGDGIPDQLFAGRQTEIGGSTGAGAVTLVFGKRPSPTAPLVLGPTLTPDLGVALVGGGTNNRLGYGLGSLGDIDGDGLPDYSLAASGLGRLYLVLGSSLMGQAKSGLAGVVGTDRATLDGVGVANGRESTAYFEYGYSESYGSQTPAQTVGNSFAWQSVGTEITGLVADTQYHYRLVVENALGLKAYGSDRTFKTAAVPVERCAQDNTLPGCSGYTGEKFCQEYPADAKCQEKPTVPGLSQLVVNPNAGKVRRGGKTVIWAWITSTGTKDASGVAVCANVPKRQVRVIGKRCQSLGNLAPGKTARVKFQIQVKGNAKRKARPKINFVATAGDGLGNRTATARLTVR